MKSQDNYYRTQLVVKGTPIPALRKQAQALGLWNSTKGKNDPQELVKAGREYLASRSFEDRYVALLRLAAWVPTVSHDVASAELSSGPWIEGIENWAHSDTFSSIYSRLLDSHPRPASLYSTLQKWSADSNPWKRRQALVSLFYYSSTRTRYPSFTQVRRTLLRLCQDPEFYVQRGVGWCLRESFSVYPEQTRQLFEQRLLDWSAIAFTTAIEKQKAGDRTRWKYTRRTNRSSSKPKSKRVRSWIG